MSSGREVALPSRALIGRSPTCYLQLDESLVSSEHAVIQWSEAGWSLRDLGSRNGTFVGGDRIEASKIVPLGRDRRICFGRLEDEWVLSSDDAPRPIAFELERREVVVGDPELLALPGPDEPLAQILLDRQGQWVIERDDDAGPARDRQVLKLGGDAWSLLLPDASDATPMVDQHLDLHSVHFCFSLSRNQEFATLALRAPDGALTELPAREHHYVLLRLAELRKEEASQPPEERGWITKEALMVRLAMKNTALNVAIHRARQQLLSVGLVGASGVVEVRRGERRFGSDRFEIVYL